MPGNACVAMQSHASSVASADGCHLAVIDGKEKEDAITAASISNSPLIVQVLCKSPCCSSRISRMRHLHAVHDCHCDLSNNAAASQGYFFWVDRMTTLITDEAAAHPVASVCHTWPMQNYYIYQEEGQCWVSCSCTLLVTDTRTCSHAFC